MAKALLDPRSVDTVRELPTRGSIPRDTVPEPVGVYVPPRPLAPIADHRTIQIKPVVLADHVDPRRAATELRLSAPPPPSAIQNFWVRFGVVAVIAAAIAVGAAAVSASTRQSLPLIQEGALLETSGAGETNPASPAPAAETNGSKGPTGDSLAANAVPVENASGPGVGRHIAARDGAHGRPAVIDLDAPLPGEKVDTGTRTRKKTRDPWLD